MISLSKVAEKIGKKRKPAFSVYWENSHRIEVFVDQSEGKRVIDYLSVRFNKTDYCIYLDEKNYRWECLAEHGCDTIAESENLTDVLAKTKEHSDKVSLMYRQVTDIGHRDYGEPNAGI